MYRSTSYAGQRSKSVFLEVPERSAEAARLLQQARGAQPEGPPGPRRASVRRVASHWDHLLQRIGSKLTHRRAEARG
jgi:hypothetical protein